MSAPAARTNALANETSPYLLQHADNPVDWQPWGPDALDRARREDKPILLSIGYSACHWCHVMAHESFEDEDTARLMNELYVNIKVDREERPDIDKIYQTAHQLLSRRTGGWPLTVMLTPDDHAPFFAGTYFPDAPRHGMPSFRQVLSGVAQLYRERREDIRKQNASLIEALASLDPGTGAGAEAEGTPLTAAALGAARAALMQSYDARHGGFGDAPKFPHPTNIERLMRDYAARPASADGAAGLAAATFTFRKMCGGGLYDHVGGGFCRYSVDAQWMIPHFEKMLYDNGPLLSVAAELHQITGDAVFARVARETAAWVMREMQSHEGGYYSTLDADSGRRGGQVLRLDAGRGPHPRLRRRIHRARLALRARPRAELRRLALAPARVSRGLRRGARHRSDGCGDRGADRPRGWPRSSRAGPTGSAPAATTRF